MELRNDVLAYYSKVAPKLADFLGKKEIASRIWLPTGMKFLVRGTKEEPLYADEFSAADGKFFSLRPMHLDGARPKLTEQQAKLWKYFPPRKLSDLFYATNSEHGEKIDRIFFDLDRGDGVTAGQALEVTRAFCKTIEDSSDYAPKAFWTGNSFHVFLMLGKNVPLDEYEKFKVGKGVEGTIAEGWIAKTQKSVGTRIVGGHEKEKGVINIDPSQTPPGKLCRAPFSLHMKDARTVDGVEIPLSAEMLENIKAAELEAYAPDKVIDNLDALAKILPKAR